MLLTEYNTLKQTMTVSFHILLHSSFTIILSFGAT